MTPRCPASLAAALVTTWALALLGAVDARADALFSLHIGVNDPPTDTDLPTLRYADDDAARFFDTAALYGGKSALLTVLDGDSARRHATLARAARPPTRAEVQRAVTELAKGITAARERGERTTVWLSYAGHGVLDAGETRLALLDGELTPADIDALVARLPADRVFLFVDACHAEGVVRGRGVQVGSPLPPADPAAVAAALGITLRARHPHLGIVLANPLSGEAQEWSAIEAGVFTHEVLSGLHGLADVNGDGRVASSELGAFIAAANRGVKDTRAQLRVTIEPPRIDPLTPLADRAWSRGATVQARAEGLGHFTIVRDDGLRVADGHLERGERFAFTFAAHRAHVLRTADGKEVTLAGDTGDVTALGPLAPASNVTGRGDARALAEGLFREPFGRAYYRGFVDSQNMVGVALPSLDAPPAPDPPSQALKKKVDPADEARTAVATGLAISAGIGGVVTVGLGVLTGVAAAGWQGTTFQREASEALTWTVVAGATTTVAAVASASLAGCAWLTCP